MISFSTSRNLVRETEELRKRLEPLSNFHSQNDLGGLRKAALAVEQLVSKVPNDISNAWYEDLQLGLKGIVAMAQRKKSRP